MRLQGFHEEARRFENLDRAALQAAERQMIADETARWRRLTRKYLRRIDRTGLPTAKWWMEALSGQGMIEFGSPRDGFTFNCWRLTERGREEMTR